MPLIRLRFPFGAAGSRVHSVPRVNIAPYRLNFCTGCHPPM